MLEGELMERMMPRTMINKKARLTNWTPISQAVGVNDSFTCLFPQSSMIVEAGSKLTYDRNILECKEIKNEN